jgi:hypothetical protein
VGTSRFREPTDNHITQRDGHLIDFRKYEIPLVGRGSDLSESSSMSDVEARKLHGLSIIFINKKNWRRCLSFYSDWLVNHITFQLIGRDSRRQSNLKLIDSIGMKTVQPSSTDKNVETLSFD